MNNPKYATEIAIKYKYNVGKTITYIRCELFIFIGEELPNQYQNTNKSKEEEVKYEIPKSLNGIGISYVTMKDFIFDPEQQVRVV